MPPRLRAGRHCLLSVTTSPPPTPSPRLLQTLLAAALVNLVPTVLLVTTSSYDAETHLFFADHYARGWFEGWEPRWYGGFWVYSYPPLLHQGVALVSRVTDLETAFRCVQLGLFTALPLSVWLLAETVAGASAAGWAAAFAVASAGVYTTVYAFGQLPTLGALVLMLAATAFLVRWLDGGRPLDLLAWTGLGGACVATHHLTGIVGQPLLALAALLHLTLRAPHDGDPPRLARLGRVAGAAMAFAVAAGTVLQPFLWWSHHGRVPQAEIPHLTRTDFLANEACRWLLVVGEWGVVPLLLPFMLWACLRQRALWAWTLLVALLATLSLGPAYTDLPAIMFPGWSYWLTYERFALWGALLALVPFGAGAAGPRARPLVLALLVLSGHVALQAATYTATTPLVHALDEPGLVPPLADWLSSHGRDRWRYVTFGFGEGEMVRLSRLTTAATIDGTYFTARRDPLLSRSGIGCVDTIDLESTAKTGYLRAILSAPNPYSLRWAISATAESAKLLHTVRWTCLGTMKARELTPWLDPSTPPDTGLTVWMAPKPCHVPPNASEPPSAPPLLAVIWGVAPLALLALGVCAGAASQRRTVATEHA